MFRVEEDNIIVPEIKFNTTGKGTLIDNKEILVLGDLKKSIGYKQFGPLYVEDNYDAFEEAFRLLSKDHNRIFMESESNEDLAIDLWNEFGTHNIQGCIYNYSESNKIIREWAEFALQYQDIDQAVQLEED